MPAAMPAGARHPRNDRRRELRRAKERPCRGLGPRGLYREIVERKFRVEAAGHLADTQMENAPARLRRIEHERLQEIARYIRRPESHGS